MKNQFILSNVTVSWLPVREDTQSPQTDPIPKKMSVVGRLQKARAAKAAKRLAESSSQAKAVTTDYYKPTVKAPRGPNGEVVHVGERGGQFYINRQGNKTYLASNQ